MTITCEKWCPFILSVSCGIISFFLLHFFNYNIDLTDSLLQSGITVAAIFAGFDAVHKNTLIGLQSDNINRINSTNYRELLRSYIDASLNTSIIFIISSIIASLLLKHLIGIWCFPVWLTLFLWMILTFWRINRIMRLLI